MMPTWCHSAVLNCWQSDGGFFLLNLHVYLRIEDLAEMSFLNGDLDNWCQIKQAQALKLDKYETEKIILNCNQMHSNMLALSPMLV